MSKIDDDDDVANGLTTLIATAHEMGWEPLIIADSSYGAQGIIIGPKKFVEDFKKLYSNLKQLEEELTNALETDEGKDVLSKLIKSVPDDDDDSGTVH